MPGRIAGKPFHQVIERHRVADKKALAQIAVVRGEKGKLCCGFYAFRDDGDIQAVSHRDDRGDQRRISGITGQVADEGLVDLERADRVAFQIAQAGVTGAEIVDGDGHAEFVEFEQG